MNRLKSSGLGGPLNRLLDPSGKQLKEKSRELPYLCLCPGYDISFLCMAGGALARMGATLSGKVTDQAGASPSMSR